MFGAGVLIVGAAGAFSEIYAALNTIWRTPPAKLLGVWSFVRARLPSFGLVLTGFLMTTSLMLSAALAAMAKFAAQLIPAAARPASYTRTRRVDSHSGHPVCDDFPDFAQSAHRLGRRKDWRSYHGRSF